MTEEEQPLLNLNARCCGGNGAPNAWENPSLTGINKLPPHSRNIREMEETISQQFIRAPRDDEGDDEPDVNLGEYPFSPGKYPTGSPPCACLDSFQLEQSKDDSHGRAKMSDVQSDDGWKFRLFPGPKTIPRNYILPSSRGDDLTFCSKTTSIPSNWTMESHQECCGVHDPPRYTNVQMPFDVLYPHVPESNPTGVYRLEFSNLPESWFVSDIAGTKMKRRVVLHLGGVESCFFVYLNGQFVGVGKDSRLPSEFDVTKQVNYKIREEFAKGYPIKLCSIPNENTLVIVVLKWSDGSFLEQQDHWRGMGGIHRSVFLYSTPADAYIEDVFCQASIANINQKGSHTFPPQYRGRLKIEARIGRGHNTVIKGKNIYYNEQVDCNRSDEVTYRMMFQLFDSKGKSIFEEPIDPSYEGNKLVKDAHLRSNLISFQVDVPRNILAWSDESPTLYRLRATLVQINPANPNLTSDIDLFNCSVGFRNIEISDRQLLVNGQPVLIKGVNRHDHSSTRGKAVSLDEILQDLRMMKEYNFNAVRTAHYPNDPYLYDMADKLGLYVIDEANIECHGHYDMICREHSFAAAMLDRTQRMVIRDQNHPSIIGWSLGNEAGFAANHTMLYGWIKGYDNSRFVQYEGANRPVWGQLPHVYDRKDSALGTDIICPMYPTIDELIEWADEIAPLLNETRPLIMCEYAHAMGNSSGSLADYFSVMKGKRGLQGGFIWDWIDQGIKQENVAANVLDTKISHRYGGDYGDKPNDANFNINGMIGPDRVAHPAMHEHKKCAQPVDFELNWPQQEDGQFMFKIRVLNRRYFTTLGDLIGVWNLKVGGFTVKKGDFALPSNILPQTSADVSMPEVTVALIEAAGDLTAWLDAEIHLDIGVKSQESFDAPFPAEDIASDQFPINEYISPASTESSVEPLYLKKMLTLGKCNSAPTVARHGGGLQGDCIDLSSKGFMVKFKQGSVGFEYSRGKKLVSWDMKPNLFRAGTDNDGVKQLGAQAEDKTKPLGRWLRLGLDCLTLENVEVDIGSQTLGDKKVYHSVVTKASMYGAPGKTTYEGIELAEKVASSLQDQDQRVKLGRWQQRVTMHSNGCLFIETKIDLEEHLYDMPRVGVQFCIPGTMTRECSFSDGPWENYPDRRLAAHAGVVTRLIEEYPRTYVVPQEQGNRMNMRWLFLSESLFKEGLEDNRGPPKSAKCAPATDLDDVIEGKKGMLIAPSGKLLQFNVSCCTDTQIFKARHVDEVEVSKDTIYVRLDAAQRGLGTGSCGPQTLPEYQVNSGTYEINFWLKPTGL